MSWDLLITVMSTGIESHGSAYLAGDRAIFNVHVGPTKHKSL